MKGTGYKNDELVISMQTGFNGSKLVQKESGGGNIITDRTELEAERQIGSGCDGSSNLWIELWKNEPGNTTEPGWPELSDSGKGDFGPWGPWVYWDDFLPFHINSGIVNGQQALVP